MADHPVYVYFAIVESDDGAKYFCPSLTPLDDEDFSEDAPYLDAPLAIEIDAPIWQAIKPHIEAYLDQHADSVIEGKGPASERIRGLGTSIGFHLHECLTVITEVVDDTDPERRAILAKSWFEDHANRNSAADDLVVEPTCSDRLPEADATSTPFDE